MRFIFSNIITVLLITFPFNYLIEASEIRNIQTGQTARQAYIQYDLIGKPGEKEAEITVNFEVEGKQYNSDKLALSGDYGKKVKIGIGKRIWWDLLKDMPAGFSGEVVWNIETVENLSDVFFEVTSKTVLDRASGLVWARLNKYEKLNYPKARSLVDFLNKRSFGGFDNWRIPTESEMMSLFKTSEKIASQGKKTPFVVLLQYFNHLENWRYWIDAPRGFQNWPSVDLETGDVNKERDHTIDNCVLPVRSQIDVQEL